MIKERYSISHFEIIAKFQLAMYRMRKKNALVCPRPRTQLMIFSVRSSQKVAPAFYDCTPLLLRENLMLITIMFCPPSLARKNQPLCNFNASFGIYGRCREGKNYVSCGCGSHPDLLVSSAALIMLMWEERTSTHALQLCAFCASNWRIDG